MPNKNNIFNAINVSINGVETSLGLNGSSLKGLPLKPFLGEFKVQVQGCSAESILELRKDVTKFASTLSYLNCISSFKNYKILDFSVYDDLDILSGIIVSFNDANQCKKFKEENLNVIIEYLTILEERNRMLPNTLSYKMLRLFIVFLCIGANSDAFVVAHFIKDQFWLNQGFNPNAKASVKDLESLQTQIKSGKKHYRRKITYKIKNSVVELGKKAFKGNPSEEEEKDTNPSEEKEKDTNPSANANIDNPSEEKEIDRAKEVHEKDVVVNQEDNVPSEVTSVSKSKTSVSKSQTFINKASVMEFKDNKRVPSEEPEFVENIGIE